MPSAVRTAEVQCAQPYTCADNKLLCQLSVSTSHDSLVSPYGYTVDRIKVHAHMYINPPMALQSTSRSLPEIVFSLSSLY